MSKELHDQIMNIQGRRSMSTFATAEDRKLYAEGHRDARHAAAELAIGYVAAPSVASAAPELPEPHWKANGSFSLEQIGEHTRAAVLAERESIAQMVDDADNHRGLANAIRARN